ncbi:hypothetical protein LTR37_009233 [Vermiconidia calcicola]|uniref:Uncharacterized protein n=1 Tax=Vermiconidia calcicola TaxID=1690605 RepID=A0ACC3N942_9PEZI|nr:hypothetical protein LTR37_009233 [Vermiconidia calcicola]
MKPNSTLDRLEALDTNTVSNALDLLGLRGATFGLQPLWNCPKVVGRASIVEVGPKTDNTATGHILVSVVDANTTNDRTLVISGGIEGISCWGDILASASKAKQLRCTIIDGWSRDIEGSGGIGYPVYGRGVIMISARKRLVQVSAGKPLNVRGVTVDQDDYVIADRCGTVFVPAQRIQEVLELAESINHRQEGMVQAVRAGRPVSEVMQDMQSEAINSTSAIPTTSSKGLGSKQNPRAASPEDRKAITDEYPLFTTWRWMRTGKDRVEVADVNETVSIWKARVEPRDIIVAEANGVLVAPNQRAREVAEAARKIEENESRIRELLTSGSTIAEARAEFGCDTLQRK